MVIVVVVITAATSTTGERPLIMLQAGMVKRPKLPNHKTQDLVGHPTAETIGDPFMIVGDCVRHSGSHHAITPSLEV